MAGKITSLRFQKRTAERVNLYLDGEFAFGIPALDAAKLKVGQELSDADIAKLRASDGMQRAYDRAILFLSYRPRSIAEVRQNLVKADVDEAVIDAVIDRLIERGYVDDAEFARFWLDNRQRFRPKGARALHQELYQKGVPESVISDVLTDLDPMTGAYEAGRKRALRLAGLAITDMAGFRRKLSDFLLRRGFEYGVVREVVARLADEMTADPTAADIDE